MKKIILILSLSLVIPPSVLAENFRDGPDYGKNPAYVIPTDNTVKECLAMMYLANSYSKDGSVEDQEKRAKAWKLVDEKQCNRGQKYGKEIEFFLDQANAELNSHHD